jgi:general secretion pathway protein J
MTMNRRQASGEAGFTLIEILIALTLMVGILAALATLTAQWLPNWDRGFADVQRKELLARALERIVADLSAAEYVTANGKAKQVLFAGNELAVTFVRSAIGPNTRPGLEFVRIATTSDREGLALVRTRAPFTILPAGVGIGDVTNYADPVVLMRPPYRAVFAYAGPDRVWRNVWQDPGRLPAAVRLSVLDTATRATLSSSTATIVHVDTPAECVTAKVLRDCVYPQAKGQGDGR